MLLLHLLLVAALALFASAASITSRKNSAPPMKAEPHRRRGIAYNDEKFVRYFNVENTQVGWGYNWYSTGDLSGTAFEYVPMLWGDHDEFTGKWLDGIKRAANEQPDNPTHLLAFNEPDMCE